MIVLLKTISSHKSCQLVYYKWWPCFIKSLKSHWQREQLRFVVDSVKGKC